MVVAPAARRRAPAAVLVVRRRASVAARAAAAHAAVAARRWAGSGAASTSWTTRRYCYCARCRTRRSTRRCRRSGPCPARRPAATASRWSRPPTRAACTSGRRRGEPLLCGLPLFLGCPIRSSGRSDACYGCLWIAGTMGAAPSDEWHIWWLSEPVVRQSASVTSQARSYRAGRTLDFRALCNRGARPMDCGQSSSASVLQGTSQPPASIFVKSFLLAQDRGCTSTQFRG